MTTTAPMKRGFMPPAAEGSTIVTSVTLSERDAAAVAAETRAKRRRALEAPVLGVAGVLLVTLLVELIPRLGIVDARFLPPASKIFAELFRVLGQSTFWGALGDTLMTWFIGLAVAMVLGVSLGMLIGSVEVLKEFTASTIEFLRPIPSVALIPLVVLLLGTQRPATLVLVIYAAFWQVLVQVLYGVADVDPVARDTARSYRFKFISEGYWVVWPTALPYVVTGFRLAATVALILTLTGELIIGTPGLGQLIAIAQSGGAVPRMYALIVTAGILGVLVNVLARFVEAKALFWHPSVRKEAAS